MLPPSIENYIKRMPHSTLTVSNFSSLITCAVLFALGSGPVRGFAVTLAIGIFVSLFSAIFVVRTFIEAQKL